MGFGFRNGDARKLLTRNYGVASQDQLLAAEFSKAGIHRAVASGALERVLPVVYRLVGSPRTWKQDLMAVTLWAGGGCAIGGPSAARLLQLDGDWKRKPIHLLTTRNVRSPAPWVVVRKTSRLEAGDVVSRHGIPVTSPARTLLDLGATEPIDHVELALDDSLRKGLVSLPYMRRLLRRVGRQGRGGTRILRDLVDARPDDYIVPKSPLEGRVLQLMRKARLPDADRQFPVEVDGRTYRADFAYPQIRLMIEAQSRRFHFSPDDWHEDLQRKSALARAGWRMIETTWKDVTVDRARTIQLFGALRDEVLGQMSFGIRN
jgi:very-short-patch-repair endonuclease